VREDEWAVREDEWATCCSPRTSRKPRIVFDESLAISRRLAEQCRLQADLAMALFRTAAVDARAGKTDRLLYITEIPSASVQL
jgi:hypothetical protein